MNLAHRSKKILFFFSFISLFLVGFAELSKRENLIDPKKAVSELQKPLLSSADSLLKTMTLDEKIAQLLIIRAHSNYNNKKQEEVINTVMKYGVGGICMFQGGPMQQVALTNKLQKASKIPLLISIDGEWGVAMRLDSCTSFPKQMSLGAIPISDNYLLYDMGKEMAEQCKALGIHLNFAPDIDINNNPDNPVINFRSFGENKELVSEKAIALMKGMQENGIITSAKHFPGHGNTNVDSHKDLPVIANSKEELEQTEFYPFKKMIAANVDMVMIAHLNVPALDPDSNSISSLSYPIITNILKNELGFKGIVITDAMEMSALRKHFPNDADAEIQALLSGVDILLLPANTGNVIEEIKKAVIEGRISEKMIDEKCLKVLRLKEKLGLLNHYQFKPLSKSTVYDKMSSVKATTLIHTLRAKSLTLLKNESHFPLNDKVIEETAMIFIGGRADSVYYKNLCKKNNLAFFSFPNKIGEKELQQIKLNTKKYDHLIIALFGTTQSPINQYGILPETVASLTQLTHQKECILALFGNPYALNLFEHLSSFSSILVGYEPYPIIVECAMDAMMGRSIFEGKLPVSIHGFPAQSGITTIPEQNQLFNALTLDIDALVEQAIKDTIIPGCQIMAIHHGKVIFDKCYGYLTYEKETPVTSNIIYDIASLTKVAATTLAVMKLYDEKKLKLSDKVSHYLPYLAKTNKANITLVELLTHTSGLVPFIPFYQTISNKGVWDEQYLSRIPSDIFTIEVAQDCWLNADYKTQIHQSISESKLGDKKYRYSDLNFLLLQEIVETITHETLDQYVTKHFYKPLDLKHLCFKPLKNNFIHQDIAPTEYDELFRKQFVQGYVHDQTAAIMGGVCGNAGLFANAHDLAVIFQMIAQDGEYEDIRYLSKSTVSYFKKPYNINGCKRRGLGFDVPDNEGQNILPKTASPHTFGHTGFTGTVVWCDPKKDLIYIFLSNRVYPSVTPNKLANSKLRLKIQEIFYKYIDLKK